MKYTENINYIILKDGKNIAERGSLEEVRFFIDTEIEHAEHLSAILLKNDLTYTITAISEKEAR